MTSRLSPNLGALDLRGDGRPTIVLRHDLPDGSHHFDWMLATDQAGKLPLLTFRLETSLRDLVPGQSAPARRLPDHRPMYLEYEGPVSGDRGQVHRQCRGRIASAFQEAIGRWIVEIDWQEHGSRKAEIQILRLEALRADVWKVSSVGSMEMEVILAQDSADSKYESSSQHVAWHDE